MSDQYLLEREGVKDFPLDAYCRAVGINKKELCRRVESGYINLMRWQADGLLPRAFILRMFHVCGTHGFEQKGKLATPPRPWRLPMAYREFIKGASPKAAPKAKAPPIAEALRIPTEAQLRAADLPADRSLGLTPAGAVHVPDPELAKIIEQGLPEPAPTEQPTPWREVIEILLELNLTAQRKREVAESSRHELQTEINDLRRKVRQLEDDIQLANELLNEHRTLATVSAPAPTPAAAAALKQLGDRHPGLQGVVNEVLARGKSPGS